MPQKNSPSLEVKYGWTYGESGWNTGMDENLLKFSFIIPSNFTGFVNSLPSSPSPSTLNCYILNSDKRLYYFVDGSWYSTPIPENYVLHNISTGDDYQYLSGNFVKIDTASQLNTKLGSFATKEELNGLDDDLRDYVDSQISSIPRDGVSFLSTIADLRTTNKTGTVIIGENNLYTSETSTEAENLPFIVVSNNGTRWRLYTKKIIDASLFGASPSLSVDNTPVIQKAIDYCLSFTPAKSLLISERYRIQSTLMVDNPVDASSGEFYIRGVNGGGFYVDSPITLFSSRLPYQAFGNLKAPSSEYLHFDKIRFESSDRAINAYVVSDKFLRLTFESCQWRNIKCLASADYIQSWAFIGKNLMRRHQGIFLQATYGYDINIQDVNFEISGSGFIFSQFVNVIRMSGLYENSDGPFFRGGANTGSFEKLYFEHNASPDIEITGGGTLRISSHHALDNAQATPSNDFWPIVLGAFVDGVMIDGCTSNGNICNNTAAPAFSVKRGVNNAGNLEFRSNPLVDSALSAAGTNQSTATPITREFTLISAGSAGNGVRLPSANSKARYSALTIQNRTAATITVYPASGERITGNGANAGVPVTSGATIRFIYQNGDAWAQI